MFGQCEMCGQSMSLDEKQITPFGLADICSSECLSKAMNDESLTGLSFKQEKEKCGFGSQEDLQSHCLSAMKLRENTL